MCPFVYVFCVYDTQSVFQGDLTENDPGVALELLKNKACQHLFPEWAPWSDWARSSMPVLVGRLPGG